MADVERAGGCGEESCDYCCTLMGCGVRGDFCPFQPNDTKSVKYWKGSNGSYLHKQIFPFSYPCLKATILVFKVFSARDRKLIENELVKGKQKHFPIQSWIPGQCCNFLALLQELSYRVRKGPLANTYPVEHPSLSAVDVGIHVSFTCLGTVLCHQMDCGSVALRERPPNPSEIKHPCGISMDERGKRTSSLISHLHRSPASVSANPALHFFPRKAVSLQVS